MHQRNTLKRVERQPTECGEMFTNHIPDKGLSSRIDIQQHMRRLYTQTSPDGQNQNRIDYSLCSQKWRRSIRQQNQDLELTAAQIMCSLLQNPGLT